MAKTRKKRHHKKRKRKVYTKKHFSSGDGMLTSVWGPPLWHYLHVMSFNYPVKPTAADKKHYRDFICNLRNVLPCRYCRENLKKNLKMLPLTNNDLKLCAYLRLNLSFRELKYSKPTTHPLKSSLHNSSICAVKVIISLLFPGKKHSRTFILP